MSAQKSADSAAVSAKKDSTTSKLRVQEVRRHLHSSSTSQFL